MKFSIPTGGEDEETPSLSSLTASPSHKLPNLAHGCEEGPANTPGVIEKLPFEVLSLIFILGVEGQEASVHKRIIVDPESTTRDSGQTTCAPLPQLRPERGWGLQSVEASRHLRPHTMAFYYPRFCQARTRPAGCSEADN